MENKLEYDEKVEDSGSFNLPQRLNTDVARFFSGVEIRITITRKRKQRTQNQNAYYWAVVIRLIREGFNDLGESVTDNEVHEFLKFRFLRVVKYDEDTGEMLYEFSRSTSALKTFEFAIYLDQCIQFAAEKLGVTIPQPYTQTDGYLFPEYQTAKETRPDYLFRIKSYVDQIGDTTQLRQYFNQVPHWKNEPDVRAIFNNKRDDLLKMKGKVIQI